MNGTVVITVRRHCTLGLGAILTACAIDFDTDVSEFLFLALPAVPLRKAPAPIQQDADRFPEPI